MKLLQLDESSHQTSNKKQKLEASMTVVFTGFRDKNLTAECEKIGILCSDSLTKTTNVLVVLDENSTSSKVQQAQKYSVKIMNKEQFVAQYVTKK
jgi:NAD-dependent DNA ligase